MRMIWVDTSICCKEQRNRFKDNFKAGRLNGGGAGIDTGYCRFF